MARLSVLKDGLEVQSFDLETLGKSNLLLGRGVGADIKIDDRAAGREHAVILFNSKGMLIQKRSKFGHMAVNGVESVEATLKNGDIIDIASYQVRVEGNAKPQAAALSVSEEPSVSVDSMASIQFGDPVNATVAAEPLHEEHSELPALEDVAPPVQVEPIVAEAPKEEVTSEVSLDQQSVAGLNESVAVENNQSEIGVDASVGDRTAVISATKLLAKLAFRDGEANVSEFVIQKPEISIGRGSSCDVILNDKKSSRKHLVIKRVGAVFVARDMGSANGTLVNGNKISDHELSSDDVIKVGDTEFTFSALSQDYVEQAPNLMAVPTELSDAPSMSSSSFLEISESGSSIAGSGNMPEVQMSDVPMVQAGMQDQQPMQPAPAFAASSGFSAFPGTNPGLPKKKSISDQLNELPLPKKIFVLILAAGVLFMLIDGFEEKPAVVDPKSKKVDKADASFNALSQEKKEYVQNTYQLAQQNFQNKEYEKTILEVDRITQILPGGYKDSKELKVYAQNSLNVIKNRENEERRKAAEDKLRAEIADLVKKAEALVEQGKDEDAKLVLSEILQKDPENATVLRLRQLLDERDQRRRSESEIMQARELKRSSLADLIGQGRKLYSQQRYYEAIDLMLTAPTLFAGDDKLLGEARSIISKSKNALFEKTKPHLDSAFSAMNSEDFTTARDEYLAALKIDYKNVEAKKGMAKIRTILHERAKVIYMHAVIAESVSDFKDALARYRDCLAQSMPGDIYFERCTRKVAKFKMGEANANPERRTAADAVNNDPKPPSFESPGDGEKNDE